MRFQINPRTIYTSGLVLTLLFAVVFIAQHDLNTASAKEFETQTNTESAGIASGSTDITEGSVILDSLPRIYSIIQSQKEQISDLIAYEILFRIVQKAGSQSLLRKTGFTDVEIEWIQADAASVSDTLTSFDRQARDAREELSDQKNAERDLEKELSRLTKYKNERLSMAINRMLPTSVSPDGKRKLQVFVEDIVKTNTKRMVFREADTQLSAVPEKDGAGIMRGAKNKEREIFLFSHGWQDGMTIRTAGVILDENSTNSLNRITTTVTSSEGRSSSTNSGWGKSSLTNDASLQIGRDHVFTTSVLFEKRHGFSDNGRIVKLHKSNHLIEETPTVSIGNVTPMNASVFAGQEQQYIVSILSTSTVPAGTQVVVEFNEASNVSNVTYTVNGAQIRTRTVMISAPQQAETATFTLAANIDSGPGLVTSQARIDSATNNVTIQSPGFVNGIMFTVATPTPTPSPTPTPTPSPTPTPTPGADARTLFLSGIRAGLGSERLWGINV